RLRIDLVEHREPGVIALARDRDDVMGHELEEQSDQRPLGRLRRRRNHAVRRNAPDEAVRHAAKKHRLEQTGVIEKRHQTDARPRIARRLADPPEIVAIETLAEVLQEKQQREHEDAAKEAHGHKRLARPCRPSSAPSRRYSRALTTKGGRSETARQRSGPSLLPRV